MIELIPLVYVLHSFGTVVVLLSEIFTKQGILVNFCFVPFN